MLKWPSIGQPAGHIGIWKQKPQNCSQVLKAVDSLYSRQVLSFMLLNLSNGLQDHVRAMPSKCCL